jgi:hypothetical protein
MFTRLDFLRAIADRMSQYPAAAALFVAEDSRLLAQIDAMATMLAMTSQQIEVSSAEPFIQAKDATVLAEASLRGILPFARAAKGMVKVTNTNASPYLLSAGRVINDSSGRPWVVVAPATIAPTSFALVDVMQSVLRTASHTVAVSEPFYRIEIPQPSGDQFIEEVALSDSNARFFNYSPDYINVGPGDSSFHVETDEFRRVYVKFGYGA